MALLARILVLVFAVHTSGLLHGMWDVVQAFTDGVAHHDSDCDDEGSGDECPPACPTCHCSHRTVPLADVSICAPARVLSFFEVLPLLHDDTLHDDPVMGSVYRPPRHAVPFA